MCRSAADVEFTTPPSTPGSPAATPTFAERRLQRTKSSGLSSAPSAGNASMSGALAAAGGSTELVDMRGYEDSGLHAPKAAGMNMEGYKDDRCCHDATPDINLGIMYQGTGCLV